MTTVRRLSTTALAISALACSSPPPAANDAATSTDDVGAPEDAFVISPPDAASDPDAAPECPVLAMGHYVMDTTMFTYDGPDCTADSSIDRDYHVASFDVDAAGMVTACQCDTATDACTVGVQPPFLPNCDVIMECHGNGLRVTFASAMRAELRQSRLASGAGTCNATGPFLPR